MTLHPLADRKLAAELMDDPALDAAAHDAALRALSRVHHLSGTGVRLRRTLARVAGTVPPGRPLRVLDVGCGGGDSSLAAARWGRDRNRSVEVVALDLSAQALAFARRRSERAGLGITFTRGDAVVGLPDGPFDLVVSSLFLHHLSDDQVTRLLDACVQRSRQVVMEDLRRSRLGLLLAHVTLRLVSRSRVAWHDGPSSVRAGWRRSELAALARGAGLHDAQVRWGWPERWILTATGRLGKDTR